ncbi:MAG TPA: hypothetical protein VES61_07970 [Gaiellaceae bacterium]|nr:hypothetical protein [Gaiellaceae bacterium]
MEALNGEGNDSRTHWQRPDAPLGTLIFREGLLSAEQLEDSLGEAVKTGKRLGQVLVDKGLLQESQVARIIAKQKGLGFVNLGELQIDPDTARLLPHETAWLHHALPIGVEDGLLVVAVEDPTDEEALQTVKTALGREARFVVATRSEILRILDELSSQKAPQPVPPGLLEGPTLNGNSLADTYSSDPEPNAPPAPVTVELSPLRIAEPEPDPEQAIAPEPELDPAAVQAPEPVLEPVLEPEPAAVEAPAAVPEPVPVATTVVSEPPVAVPEPVQPAAVAPEPVQPAVEPAPMQPAALEPAPVQPPAVEPEPVQPAVEPAPMQPAAVEPAPVQPLAVEPEPVQPAAVEPELVQPQAIEPEPVWPAEVEPAPVLPAAVEPEPVHPTAVEPAPVQLATVEPAPVQPQPAAVEPAPPAETAAPFGQSPVAPAEPDPLPALALQADEPPTPDFGPQLRPAAFPESATPEGEEGATLAQAVSGSVPAPRSEGHEVVVRLTDGEVVSAGSFPSGDMAKDAAKILTRQIASSPDGEWPEIGGRFVRPDLIVSVDVV